MHKNAALLVLSLISLLLIAGIAKAEMMDWHKPTPCVGCHAETLGADYGSGECGNCHDYRSSSGEIDVPLMQSQHNPKICKGCHMGNTLVDASEKEIFHNGHNNVKCTQCHTENNFTVIKIGTKGFECVSCHGNQVHGIHIKNLDKTCPTCHGSWAKDKVYIGNTDSSSLNTSNKSQQNSNLEKFTIFSFIKSLFNIILGVK